LATVTSLLVLASFLMGCATFVVGVRVGHGSSTLVMHMTWGALTLVVQLFAVCVATIHARHSEQQIALLQRALAEAEAGRSGADAGGSGGSTRK
jgi:uncharacterized membrane protein YjfL (UPF0719 family)